MPRSVKIIWSVLRYLLSGFPASLGVPLVAGAGWAMVYGDDFTLGMAFLGISAIWGIAAWLLSDELIRRKAKPPKKQRYAQIAKYERDRRLYLFWQLGIPVAILAVLVLGLFFADSKRETKILREYEGFLLPGNETDPPSFCSDRIGRDALKVFVGNNEAYSSQFPFVLLRAKGKDRVIVDRDDAGKLALTVDFLDEKGRVIVTFEHGHFTIVQSNILDMKRPNRSTLIVRDQFKNEVLYVEYLNKNSLLLSGLLRYPGVGVIPIPKTRSVNGICVGNSRVVYDIE